VGRVEKVEGDIRLGEDKGLDSLKVTYINAGRGPALSLHLTTQIECAALGVVPTTRYTEDGALKEGRFVLVPGQETHSNFWHDDAKSVCTPEEMDLVKSERGLFYIQGTIWYEDIFKRKHHTDFCAYIEPIDKAYTFCSFHNEAD